MSYAKRMIHFKSSKAFQGYVHTTLHTPIKSIHWISRTFHLGKLKKERHLKGHIEAVHELKKSFKHDICNHIFF